MILGIMYLSYKKLMLYLIMEGMREYVEGIQRVSDERQCC